MKYLLDTHVIIWLAYHEDRLNPKVKNILLQKSNEFYISLVSIWEINIKYSIGKLSLKDKTPEQFFESVDEYFNPSYLSLDPSDAISFYQLQSFHHRDPFDRMMIWQAIRNKMIFITDDLQIQKYSDCGLNVLW